ncbi:hypothetical protein D3C78_1759940 [compost metagenome]
MSESSILHANFRLPLTVNVVSASSASGESNISFRTPNADPGFVMATCPAVFVAGEPDGMAPVAAAEGGLST